MYIYRLIHVTVYEYFIYIYIHVLQFYFGGKYKNYILRPILIVRMGLELEYTDNILIHIFIAYILYIHDIYVKYV